MRRRLGTVVEWKDTTAEKAIEEEINDMVKAAVDGDLTGRLALESKTGFMLNLATAMNKLCKSFADFHPTDDGIRPRGRQRIGRSRPAPLISRSALRSRPPA